MPFKIIVYDNFFPYDDSECDVLGVRESYEDAVAYCKALLMKISQDISRMELVLMNYTTIINRLVKILPFILFRMEKNFFLHGVTQKNDVQRYAIQLPHTRLQNMTVIGKLIVLTVVIVIGVARAPNLSKATLLII
jgi:hypothetical protein